MKRNREKKRTVSLAQANGLPTVLHVSTFPDWRGGEQQLAALWKGLDERGCRQVIACARGTAMEAYCREHGITHVALKKRAGFDPVMAKGLQRIVRDLEVDIVHTHDAHAHTIALIANILWRVSRPIVISRRVDFPIGGFWLSRFKYNAKRVGRIVCVSDAIRDIVRASVKSPEKVVTVRSGFDPSRFRDRKKKGKGLRACLDIDDSMHLIGNVAALAPHKDHFTFIETAAQLGERRSDLFFVIIGEGPERAAIEAYIREKGMSDRIVLTGFRDDIPDILPELDLFLMSSRTEGLGTSILDAFWCGVPVVSTEAGGIPEMVEHEVTGLLAHPGDPEMLADQVIRLLNDRELYERLLRNAEKRVADHDISNTVQRTLDIYRTVLTEHPRT